MRVLGGFYNGRDARCAICGRDARHPDKGQDARPSCAAKTAAFPVRPRQAWPLPWWIAPPSEAARAPLPRGARQARPLPWRRSRDDRPTWRSGCSLRGTSHIRISEVARDQPGGVIVPHRNRMRFFGGAFTTGGTPVVPVAGETPATPITGKMPVVPVHRRDGGFPS